jgi:adenylosuccinate synthase
VDDLVLTNLDRLAGLPSVRAAVAYEVDGETVTDLPLPADREAQAALTRRVVQARPVHADFPAADDAFLALVDAVHPVTALSRGPTFADKFDRLTTNL